MKTAEAEIVKDWTYEELKRELLIWRGIELGTTQFYNWLPYALITPCRVYGNRDRKKLLKFASLMKRYKRLQVAKDKLIEHMNTHPEEYPND